MNAKPKRTSKTPADLSTRYEAYMGIDPGQEGGIAVVMSDVICTYLMPESDLDLRTIIEAWVNPKVRTFVCLEHVSSSPQMGVTSAFTFGEGFGRLHYALIAARLPFDLVRPQKWQKTLGIPPRNKQTESQPEFKERLRQAAQRLFPKLSIWSEPKSLGRQRAICDALLLAQYGQLVHR